MVRTVPRGMFKGMESMSWDDAVASSIVNEYKHLAGAALPILHALQENFGYVDKRVVPLIADALNMSKAEIYGAITFYHDFREAPAGKRVVKLCRAEACQSMGHVALLAHVRTALGIDFNETTADGLVTLEPVFCLGLCACAPALTWDDAPHGRADAALVDELLASA